MGFSPLRLPIPRAALTNQSDRLFNRNSRLPPKVDMGIIRLMILRRHRGYIGILATLLLGISAAGAPVIARAEVHVEGTVAAVRVTTNKDAIPDVLSALAAPFNVRYRTSVPLDGNASSAYSGSLVQVISRLLNGYNYVIAHDQETIEIVVLGKRGEAFMPVQKPAPSTKGIAAQWR
jgi:hypothetical protein